MCVSVVMFNGTQGFFRFFHKGEQKDYLNIIRGVSPPLGGSGACPPRILGPLRLILV